MQNNKYDLSERFLEFAATSIQITGRLYKSAPGRYIANQQMRSAASAGANYEEACVAESRADFIHKMRLVLKELRESLYWIKLILKTKLMSNNTLNQLQIEDEELVKIVSKSITTAHKGEK